MNVQNDLPPVTCRVPKKLDWQLNASTGGYIARVGPVTRLIRYGITPKGRFYRAEYWGDYSFDFPISVIAFTPKKALRDLCNAVTNYVATEES